MRGERRSRACARKGQVTLFFAIGIALLIVLGVAFLLIRLASRDAAERDQSDQTIESTGSQVLSNVVGSCMDAVVEDELMILGRSGGLHPEEGYPKAFVGSGATERVILYGLTRNRDTPPDGMLPYALDPPAYPHPTVGVDNATTNPVTGRRLEPAHSGFFGDVQFPPLCDRDGPNAQGGRLTCRSYPGSPGISGEHTTQELLERRIMARVQSCASPRLFEQALGQEVVEFGTPDTEVTFTYTGMLVTLTYPLTLSGQTAQRVEKMTRSYPVRFLPVAQFARDLALEESRNIQFNLTKDYRALSSYREGFTVTRAPVTVRPDGPEMEPDLWEKADMVTITDSRSTVDGISYSYTFLIEHRAPMLDTLTGRVGCTPLQDVPEMVRSGALKAYDPDDGGVVIGACTDYLPDSQCPGMITVFVLDQDGEEDWEITDCPVT